MTVNAVIFVLLILGLTATIAEFLFKGFYPFMFGIFAFAVWVISSIMVVPEFPYMLIIYLFLMVVNMVVAFVKVGK